MPLWCGTREEREESVSWFEDGGSFTGKGERRRSVLHSKAAETWPNCATYLEASRSHATVCGHGQID